jgi:hypothetical protein
LRPGTDRKVGRVSTRPVPHRRSDDDFVDDDPDDSEFGGSADPATA